MKIHSLVLGALFLSSVSFGVQVRVAGTPKANGTGCPDGSVEVIPLEDGSGVTLLFSKWALTIGKDDQKDNVFSKDSGCTIAIPLAVPPGFRLTSLSVSYDGFANLPRGAFVQMLNRYQFIGQGAGRPVNTKATLTGPVSDNFTFKEDDLTILSQVKSPCGKAATMSIGSRLNLRNDNRQEAASVTVDALNLVLQEKFKITYRWQDERCF